MVNIFNPDAAALKAAGFGSVGDVPVAFNDDWSYAHELNRYLRERARCEWTPKNGHNITRSGFTYPTAKTLEAYARNVGNFNDWCLARGLDWRELNYTDHMVDGYQNDMLEGRWSVSGEALNPNTVNLRVVMACHFLTWAGERGLRPPFAMIVKERAVDRPSSSLSSGHRQAIVDSRAGSVKANPRALRLPTRAELDAWLDAVRRQRTETKALVCETVLVTAVRLAEVAEWRVDTLPLRPEDWRVDGNGVRVTIKYGAKGPKYRDPNGDLYGPPRDIYVPIEFARKLHAYREGKRIVAVAKWVKSARTATERARRIRTPSNRLFLTEHSGVPISRGAIYEAWTEVLNQPFAHWSPHGGRHCWACMKMLTSVDRNAQSAGRTLDAMPGDWVVGQATNVIDMEIRPQLGHVDRETTMAYLQWVKEVAVLPAIAESYRAFLEGSDG